MFLRRTKNFLSKRRPLLSAREVRIPIAKRET